MLDTPNTTTPPDTTEAVPSADDATPITNEEKPTMKEAPSTANEGHTTTETPAATTEPTTTTETTPHTTSPNEAPLDTDAAQRAEMDDFITETQCGDTSAAVDDMVMDEATLEALGAEMDGFMQETLEDVVEDVEPPTKRRRITKEEKDAEKAKKREEKQQKAEMRAAAKRERDQAKEQIRAEKAQAREAKKMDRLKARSDRQVVASVRTSTLSLCDAFASLSQPASLLPSTQPPPSPTQETPESQGLTPVLLAPPSSFDFVRTQSTSSEMPLRRTASILQRQATLSQRNPEETNSPTQTQSQGDSREGSKRAAQVEALPTTTRLNRINSIVRAAQAEVESSDESDDEESCEMELELIPEDDNAVGEPLVRGEKEKAAALEEEARRIASRHELMRFRQESTSAVKFDLEHSPESQELVDMLERSASGSVCNSLSKFSSKRRMVGSGSMHVRDDSLAMLKKKSVKDTSGTVLYQGEDSQSNASLTASALQANNGPLKSGAGLKNLLSGKK